MKNRRYIKFGFATLLAAAALLSASPTQAAANTVSPSNKPLKIAIVNFKTVVEQSKLGKQEQANFESLKKQMETVLEEKEKSLNDMASKFNDPDYLDSLSAEAETEIKRKFRALNQELSGYQNQYMQILQQTNLKVIQKLTEAVSSASSKYAQEHKIDLILNEESFYYSPDLDVSKEIVAMLDKQFDKEAAEQKDKAPKS